MTVRTRLIAGFALVTGLLLIPSLFAAGRLAELRDMAVGERERHAEATGALGGLGAALSELDRFQRSYVAAPDPSLATAALGARAQLDREMDRLRAAGYGEAAGELEPVLAGIRETTERIDDLVAENRLEAATRAFGTLEVLLAAARDRLAGMAASVDVAAQEDFRRAQAISAAGRNTTLAALLVFLAVAVALGAWTTRALTRPIQGLAVATADVAAGRFQAPDELPYDREDEIGDLSRSFRVMTRRLAELDRMKAEFVGVASHELKTPINVITGYAQLLEEELAGELTVHQAEVIHRIAEQTRVMTRLVSRLMDISRLETGTYQMEWERIHLEDLMTGLLRSFEVLAEGEGLTLESRVHDSAPEMVVVDVDIIRDEVLGNLVSNAVKHTPEGGWIRVETWGEGKWILFRVVDAGPGIPPEHRAHIFQKYYQVERSRRVGSGLGLAIASEMVEAHGGSIELEDPGGEVRGASFLVRLPLSPPGWSGASYRP